MILAGPPLGRKDPRNAFQGPGADMADTASTQNIPRAARLSVAPMMDGAEGLKKF